MLHIRNARRVDWFLHVRRRQANSMMGIGAAPIELWHSLGSALKRCPSLTTFVYVPFRLKNPERH